MTIISATDLSFPDIVRDTVRQWLKSREIKKFEEEWIEKLKMNPDNPEDAEKWLPLQHWSESKIIV